MTDPAPPQAKQTPGRRKPGARARRPNHKNYASENDVAKADSSFQPEFTRRHIDSSKNQNGSPSTPQKSQNGSAAGGKSSANAPQSASGKPNNRNNNKKQQKSNTDSPAMARSGRRTPPQTTGPKAYGPAVSAFAGATFHASPAPSSLPLPSFFTKSSSPGTPRARPASGLGQQPSPPASDIKAPFATSTIATDGPSATTTSGRNPLLSASGIKLPPPHDESPLDLLFRVDRAEKERNRRASSANLYGAVVGPFSPPITAQALGEVTVDYHTSPHNGCQQHYKQQQTARQPGPTLRTSSSGISAAELDGTPGRPMGPAFATPFQDRIRAARPTDPKGSPRTAGAVAPSGFKDLAAGSAPPPFAGAQSSQPPPVANVDDRSEALKRFLFSKTGTSVSSHSGTSPASAPTTPTRYPGAPGFVQQPSPYGGKPYQDMNPAFSASRAPIHHGYANGPVQSNEMRQSGNNGTPMNISAMEDSLRQILKLDSPFGSGTPSSGIHRQQ
ncbi:hypothetical protein SEPCBS57363_003446 [Sporothrix epigloea]|uniref:Proteophosphoglycan 5 n=1 Tax=Sporothrix epigloea TaxID=1892477 RepID=A0ABP0DQ19_9PEZI